MLLLWNGFTFVQNEEGILPKMLRILAENRKQAKRDMAKAGKEGNASAKVSVLVSKSIKEK